MKISIITATWNRGDTIRDTIESILSQTHQDWEHIIVDGASTDNTLEIIKEYENRYAGRLKLISERDNGIYDAMNKGIRMATGDVVGILNSDDFYFNDQVLHIIDKAFEMESVDSICAGAAAVKAGNINEIIRIKKGSEKPKSGFSNGWHPSHPTFYVRRNIYQKYGLFDLNFGTACDMELMIRFIEFHKISLKYIPEIFVSMRFGGASNGSIKAIFRSNKNVLKAFEKNNIKKPKFYLIKKLSPKLWNMILVKLHLINTSNYERHKS